MSPPRASCSPGPGKRYDIVSCFAAPDEDVVADPAPLAPAQYAAQVRTAVPLIDDPGYVPALARLCAEHGVGAVLPLTDLDIEVLALAREQGRAAGAGALLGGRPRHLRQVRGPPAAGATLACPRRRRCCPRRTSRRSSTR